MTEPPAADADGWQGERVTRWLRRAAALDVEFAPITELLFAAAGIRAGERVLDVGCGSGPTTRRAAGLVAPGGSATGLDVSAEMIAGASAIPADPAPRWLVADPVDWQPEPAAYDLVMSRFGVMFFSDPPRAMATLATAARPGGRLAFAVWGPRGEVEMFDLTYGVALAVLAERGAPAVLAPPEGGPFSLHDPAAVTELLAGAGWRDIEVAAHTLELRYGGGVSPAEAAEFTLDHGPARGLIAEADEATIAAVGEALVPVLAEHVDETGQVMLGASIRIVTARR